MMVYWNKNIKRKLSISAYSDNSIEFGELKDKDADSYMYNYYKQIAHIDLEENEKFKFKKSMNEDDMNNVVYLENNNPDYQVEVRYILTEAQNYCFREDFKDKLNDKSNIVEFGETEVLVLLNNGESVILITGPKDYNDAYSFNIKTKYRFVPIK